MDAGGRVIQSEWLGKTKTKDLESSSGVRPIARPPEILGEDRRTQRFPSKEHLRIELENLLSPSGNIRRKTALRRNELL